MTPLSARERSLRAIKRDVARFDIELTAVREFIFVSPMEL
jgi:hypothetical protein